MNTTKTDSNALRKYGQRLINSGYQPIPIRDKDKTPMFKGWESPTYKADLRKFLSNGAGGEFLNVGVPCRGLCVIDVDVYDKKLARKIAVWCKKHLPPTIIRVSESPKFMLFFQLDNGEAPRKFSTPRFKHPDTGLTGQIEMLGAGQQFVAYGRHPLGHNIRWFSSNNTGVEDKNGIAAVPRDELPQISPDDMLKLRQFFMDVCSESGFDRDSRGTSALRFESGLSIDVETGSTVKRAQSGEGEGEGEGGASVGAEGGELDAFFAGGGKMPLGNVTVEQAREYLNAIPNEGDQGEFNLDYEDWHKLVCGIHHQFHADDPDAAYALAYEFSARNPIHSDEVFNNKVWKYINSDHPDCTTFASVIHSARPHLAETSGSKKEQFSHRLSKIDTRKSLNDFCDDVRNSVGLERVDRELLAKMLIKQFKIVEGESPSIQQCRDLLKPNVNVIDATPDAVKFLDEYVYLTRPNGFYSLTTGELLSVEAFDNTYSEKLLSKSDRADGLSTPSIRPKDMALNVKCIPRYRDVLYVPHTRKGGLLDPETYEVHKDRSVFVNNYNPPSLKPTPASKWTPRQRAAVEFIKTHALMTCGDDERDAKIFLSWLAWKVKHPDRKIGWAVIMQGTKGSGKSIWFDLMPWLLGHDNVTMVSNAMLQEKFNSWSTRCVLNTVEEVKMDGYSGLDALNALRPVISQSHLAVRRMREDAADEQIFNDLIMASNFQDCVPTDPNERRFFPVFSEYQTREQLEEFIEQNPSYFTQFFGTDGGSKMDGMIHDSDCLSAIRGFFEGYEIHKEFNSNGFAPKSSASKRMLDMTVTPTEQLVRVMVDDNQCGIINDELISFTALREMYSTDYKHRSEWEDMKLSDKQIRNVLASWGYRPLPDNFRPRIVGDGVKHRVWVKRGSLYKLSESELREHVISKGLELQTFETNDDFLK